ncbi:CRISPR-associated endonuclease Cas2 [Candidatus Poriferisocius sp.]|uniref:CRISPR-associated endonuclease Cas2 n=1 Tax=Candidatus Poriferisocius sp. TaxID=3101276 RepID=UPI003B5C43F3
MDVIVAYDISDTDTPASAARLRRVADICSAYGERAQLSVFECRLTPESHAQLIGELYDAIDLSADCIIIYKVNGNLHDSRMVIGIDRPHRLGDTWIV